MSPVCVASSIVLTLVATTLPAAARTAPMAPAEEAGPREANLPQQDGHAACPASDHSPEAPSDARPEAPSDVQVEAHADVWNSNSVRTLSQDPGLQAAIPAGTGQGSRVRASGGFMCTPAPAVRPAIERRWLTCRFAHAPPVAS
jgi:hypothetical protein